MGLTIAKAPPPGPAIEARLDSDEAGSCWEFRVREEIESRTLTRNEYVKPRIIINLLHESNYGPRLLRDKAALVLDNTIRFTWMSMSLMLLYGSTVPFWHS